MECENDFELDSRLLCSCGAVGMGVWVGEDKGPRAWSGLLQTTRDQHVGCGWVWEGLGED